MHELLAVLILASARLALPSGSATAGSPSSGSTVSIDEAISAYRQNRIAEAKAGFGAVAVAPDASFRDRAEARRELARIAWLVDADPAGARAQLESTDAWKDKPCQTAALLVRVLRESARPAKAVQAAAAHRTQCVDSRDALLIQEIRAWADLAMASGGSLRSQAPMRMKAGLDALGEGPLGLDAARLHLDFGLLSAAPEHVFKGWCSYFWLANEDAPPALVNEFPHARELFQRAMSRAPKLSDEIELVRLLVRAGFYQEAKWFAMRRDVSRRAQTDRALQWPSIEASFRFRDAVERMTLAHYRSLAHGKDDGVAYQAEIKKLIERTASELAPKLYAAQSSPKDILRRVWGLYFTVGPTGGYMSLHLGHVIEDVREEIAQHGRTSSVQRIVLENMLSNGYESWLWDGWAQAGGWAEEGARLIQVRTSYVASVVTALGLRPGRASRTRAEAEVAELTKRDEEILQRKHLADLQGLAARLRLQTIDEILADMKAAGEAPDDDNAFQGRYWRALVGATITIHEGRHVLDQLQYSWDKALSSEELEFRAKLSELQFAEHPRLSLSKIVNGQIGGESNHAKANTRLLTELGLWIERHSPEVERFNTDRPVLSQIDQLTDQQIRVFACSRDPACQHPE
jgi:hypothetical protein